MKRNLRRSAFVTLFIAIACASRLGYIYWKMEKQSHRSWNPETRVLDWGLGSVTIPSGFDYEPAQGIDSFVGTFRSRDGHTQIHHDIGELAGEHGMTVNTISFPYDGCASFRIESPQTDSRIIAAAIRNSFKSGSLQPAWVRSFLPRWLLLDCRVGTLSELLMGPEN